MGYATTRKVDVWCDATECDAGFSSVIPLGASDEFAFAMREIEARGWGVIEAHTYCMSCLRKGPVTVELKEGE